MLVAQHWFVLVKYVSKGTYIVLELLLEIMFEWVIISNFEYFVSQHWTLYLSASVMLFAHWQYLLAAGLSLISPPPLYKKDN